MLPLVLISSKMTKCQTKWLYGTHLFIWKVELRTRGQWKPIEKLWLYARNISFYRTMSSLQWYNNSSKDQNVVIQTFIFFPSQVLHNFTVLLHIHTHKKHIKYWNQYINYIHSGFTLTLIFTVWHKNPPHKFHKIPINMAKSFLVLVVFFWNTVKKHKKTLKTMDKKSVCL